MRYDEDGFDDGGSDKDGYDRDGFDGNSIHKDTGTKYGPCGAKVDGYNDEGFNANGWTDMVRMWMVNIPYLQMTDNIKTHQNN